MRVRAFPALPPQRVLVLGAGGREHAIVHALYKSPQVERVYTSPGNFGTGGSEDTVQEYQCVCENVPAMSIAEIVRFVQHRGVSLVVVGPEKPLVEGVSDYLKEQVSFSWNHYNPFRNGGFSYSVPCVTISHI